MKQKHFQMHNVNVMFSLATLKKKHSEGELCIGVSTQGAIDWCQMPLMENVQTAKGGKL